MTPETFSIGETEYDEFDWIAGGGLGIVYGVIVLAVFLVFVWPIWLAAVGFPQAPAVPYLNPMPLIGHVVFGAVLGGTDAWFR